MNSAAKTTNSQRVELFRVAVEKLTAYCNPGALQQKHISFNQRTNSLRQLGVLIPSKPAHLTRQNSLWTRFKDLTRTVLPNLSITNCLLKKSTLRLHWGSSGRQTRRSLQLPCRKQEDTCLFQFLGAERRVKLTPSTVKQQQRKPIWP